MLRGFKTEAETIAIELRDEIGLSAHDRLDCTALAGHLGDRGRSVTSLADDGATAKAVECMVSEMGFSAMTVYRGTRCKIFYNPTHAKTRTANSVAHEISHVVLEHEPGPVLREGHPLLEPDPGGRG